MKEKWKKNWPIKTIDQFSAPWFICPATQTRWLKLNIKLCMLELEDLIITSG